MGPLLWGLVLLLVIRVLSFWGSTWIITGGRRRHSGRRSSCPAVHFSSRGPARWVGGRRWRLSRRYHFSKRRSFHFPGEISGSVKLCSFFKGMVTGLFEPLDMLDTDRGPTHGINDACSVGTPGEIRAD